MLTGYPLQLVQSMFNIAEESMKLDKAGYCQENGKERQIRALNQKLEQMAAPGYVIYIFPPILKKCSMRQGMYLEKR